MGAHHSKKKGRNLAALERGSSKKKYLPAANGTSCNGHDGSATIEDKAAQELPPFTDRQRELVVSTWKVVQEDISRVGVNMFMKMVRQHIGKPFVLNYSTPIGPFTEKSFPMDASKPTQNPGEVLKCVRLLFETHPEVQSVFMPFKGKSQEDLQDSAQLKSHALRVMGTVEKCLDNINDLVKLQKMLHDLGARHIMYNAKVDYIDLIGPQFIWAIEPVVGDQWTPEVEQAWSDLFKFISHIMKEAMTF